MLLDSKSINTSTTTKAKYENSASMAAIQPPVIRLTPPANLSIGSVSPLMLQPIITIASSPNHIQHDLPPPQLPPQLIATDMTTNGSAAIIQSSAKSSSIENGEMDEASSLGTSVTGWRDPAPYRCGHCHQVSNWKHVIQVFLLTPHTTFFL